MAGRRRSCPLQLMTRTLLPTVGYSLVDSRIISYRMTYIGTTCYVITSIAGQNKTMDATRADLRVCTFCRVSFWILREPIVCGSSLQLFAAAAINSLAGLAMSSTPLTHGCIPLDARAARVSFSPPLLYPAVPTPPLAILVRLLRTLCINNVAGLAPVICHFCLVPVE